MIRTATAGVPWCPGRSPFSPTTWACRPGRPTVLPKEKEVKPRTPALERRTAMRLAATEYGRCAELLQSLDQQAWVTPTACSEWDVRQMAAHMLGMVEMAASIR